jgi:hypothetical protein
MEYKDLTDLEKDQLENALLEKARGFWADISREKVSDLRKMNALNNEGVVGDILHHKIMERWYKKEGYWIDGITTLKEREKQLISKKMEFGIKIDGIRNGYLNSMKEIEDRITIKKTSLKNVPEQIKKNYGLDIVQIREKASEDIANFFSIYEKSIIEDVEKDYGESLKSFEDYKNTVLNDALKRIRELQTICKGEITDKINELGAELTAELTIIDSKKVDDQLMEKYQKEIKRINREILDLTTPVVSTSTRLNLDELTVPTLKGLADQNDIKYDPRILKADLIILLQNNNVGG